MVLWHYDAVKQLERASLPNQRRPILPAPGKRTLTSRIPPRAASRPTVQAKGTLVDDATAVHANAEHGISGSSAPLPHLDVIQSAFGKHDISGVRAHIGGRAKHASDAIGASAYAMGNDVAFASAPDLHTAAHEAAHVVQQRHGVQLYGGIGQVGDRYERHADAVADGVVCGQSVESLLGLMVGAGSADHAVQKREVAADEPVQSAADWSAADRATLGGTFETANLHNLRQNDPGQYTKIEERRDFYTWFYRYTASEGYHNRWALAASLVANGAHQIAHMSELLDTGARLVGSINNELQGMMRIGNHVIFDNVFPKLQALLDNGPMTGAEALAWDMKVLSEEQALIQPLYDSVDPKTRQLLKSVATKSGLSGVATGFLGLDVVDPFTNDDGHKLNNGGRVPAFNGDDIQNVNQRWHYGMILGDQFTPGGTDYDSEVHQPPTPGAGYIDGSELANVNIRPHLHMLDAELVQPLNADPARVTSLLGQLTDKEQAEMMNDQSPDGFQYSKQLAKASFEFSAFTGMYIERTQTTKDIAKLLGGYEVDTSAFISSFNTELEAMRNVSETTIRTAPSRTRPFGF